MTAAGAAPERTIRDPLWKNIGIAPMAMRLVDSPPFQRLRYVRQLGLAHLVYPGATHSRFEHALGAYHLARRTLRLLQERGELRGLAPDECEVVRSAALLHDIGHYPFSHALEEIGALHHEEVARSLITQGPIAAILGEELGATAPARVHALIRGTSDSPLRGLISGSLDLDKIEYLKRDALMCGVPYGEIDVDRLLNALTLVDDAEGCRTVGVHEKGLAALESLLFAKYQMYRNVYWHHAVRSATAMYKRIVDDARRAGIVDDASLASLTDEGLLHLLERRQPSRLMEALRDRRLLKRAVELPSGALPAESEWIASDRALVYQSENALAAEMDLVSGEVLLDFPTKPQMLGLDIPVLRRGGVIEHLTAERSAAGVSLPRLSDELYRSARWLRVFAPPGTHLPERALEQLLTSSASDVRRRLAAGQPLLS